MRHLFLVPWAARHRDECAVTLSVHRASLCTLAPVFTVWSSAHVSAVKQDGMHGNSRDTQCII